MDKDNLKFCIIDCETTGLPTNNDFSKINIIEIGWVVINKNLDVLKEENFIIKGDFHITDFIQNLTGISKKKTDEQGINIKIALEKLYNDINECQFMIAHNVFFDYSIIMQEIKNLYNNNILNIDEYNYYTNIFKNKIRLCSKNILKSECDNRYYPILNFKLETIYNYLLDSNKNQSHRAIDDVYMIIECFQELYGFDILYYFWQKKISFGKYKNKTHEWVYDNDEEYFYWLLEFVYKINSLDKLDELFYYDEEYEYDDFVVPDNFIEEDNIEEDNIEEDNIEEDNTEEDNTEEDNTEEDNNIDSIIDEYNNTNNIIDYSSSDDEYESDYTESSDDSGYSYFSDDSSDSEDKVVKKSRLE